MFRSPGLLELSSGGGWAKRQSLVYAAGSVMCNGSPAGMPVAVLVLQAGPSVRSGPLWIRPICSVPALALAHGEISHPRPVLLEQVRVGEFTP